MRGRTDFKISDFEPGFRFGSYTVVGDAPNDKRSNRRVWLQCDCGHRSARIIWALCRLFPVSCFECYLAKRAAHAKRKKRTPQQVAFNRLKRGDYASPEEMAALVRVIQHRPESSTSP